MTRRFWLCRLLLGLVLASIPFFAADAPPPALAQAPQKAEWTLLIYLDADCDLEKSIIDQVNVLLEYGSTKDVNIVLLCDRSEKGDEEDGYTNEDIANLKNWAGCKLLHVQKKKLVELADWGNVNCADPATLQKFITTAAKRFPAKKYALMLNDHGGGWSGLCSDDSFQGDTLTLNRLRAALAGAGRDVGPLEIIGFDCCLMGTVETASAVAPYGKVMIASEELEPGDGWAFGPVLKALQDKPTMNGVELSKLICTHYQEQFDKSEDEDQQAVGLRITLSAIDLSKVAELEKAINYLADRHVKLMRDEKFPGWVKVARVRARTEGYGYDGETDGEATAYDIGHLIERLRAADPGAGPACDAVARALKAAVLHQVNGQAVPHASGLTICFPRRSGDLDQGDDNKYEQLPFARNTRWLTFLRQYIQVAEAVKDKPEMKPIQVSKDAFSPEKKETLTVTSNVAGSDVDEITLNLAVETDKKKLILGQMPATVGARGELKTVWHGNWFSIGHDDHWVVCPIVGTQEIAGKATAVLAEVPGQVRKKGAKEWTDVSLHFYLDGKARVPGKFVYAFHHTKQGPRQIKLEKDDEVRPLYLEVDEDGNTSHVVPEDKATTIKLGKANDLSAAYKPVARGTYLIGFAATNLAGHRVEEEIEVKVK